MLYRSKVSLGRRLPMVPQGNLRRNLKSHSVSNDFQTARVEARCLKKIYEIVNLRVVCTGSVGAADPIDPAD